MKVKEKLWVIRRSAPHNEPWFALTTLHWTRKACIEEYGAKDYECERRRGESLCVRVEVKEL